MDDLKVILYILVAIIWVVYNNYRKISEASKKRDLSKPPAEVTAERSPEKKSGPVIIPKQLREIIEKQPQKALREVLAKKPVPATLARQQKIVKERPSFIPPSYNYNIEGGTITPSKLVIFEEARETADFRNPILDSLRSMDLRSAIIMAEVLKRPYY